MTSSMIPQAQAPMEPPSALAQSLVDELRLDGFEALGSFISVPFVLPTGFGRLQIEVEKNGFYRLACHESAVWSAIVVLGRHRAFDVCSGFEIERDYENELVQTLVDRRSSLKERFQLFVSGLQSIIWCAEGKGIDPDVRTRPTLEVPRQTFQVLAHRVLLVRDILDDAVHFHRGGHGVGQFLLSDADERHIDRLALETIMGADLVNYEMSIARAVAACTDALVRIEADLLATNDTHPQRELIVRTLQSYRRMVERLGLVRLVLGVQREYLREVTQS